MHRPSFCKTDPSSDCKSSIFGPKAGIGIRRGRRQIEQTWNPNEANLYTRRNAANSGNSLDRRSLYSIKKENIAASDLQFSTCQNGQSSRPGISNAEQFVEKKYIATVALGNATREKFPRHIMSTFFCVSPSSKTNSYGMPRRDSRDHSAYNMLMAKRRTEATMVKVRDYPDLQIPVSCNTSNEFCEVLGSSACSGCIENTNRHISSELQSTMFPAIELSTEKIVLPQLARMLGQSHKLQTNMRSTQNAAVDIWRQYRSRKLKETCRKCNKALASGTAVGQVVVVANQTKSPANDNTVHNYAITNLNTKNNIVQSCA